MHPYNFNQTETMLNMFEKLIKNMFSMINECTKTCKIEAGDKSETNRRPHGIKRITTKSQTTAYKTQHKPRQNRCDLMPWRVWRLWSNCDTVLFTHIRIQKRIGNWLLTNTWISYTMQTISHVSFLTPKLDRMWHLELKYFLWTKDLQYC